MPALSFTIRPYTPEDDVALAALERRCVQQGRVSVRVETVDRPLATLREHPGRQGWVAAASDGRIVGELWTSTAPTQIDGAVHVGTYLYNLCVDPLVRRRGVGTTLVEHAWSAARQAGARLAWAGVIEGNAPSLRLFRRLGFEVVGGVRTAVLLPWLDAPAGGVVRGATLGDIPDVTSLLNRAHAEHNFWRPLSPPDVEAELRGDAAARLFVPATAEGVRAVAAFWDGGGRVRVRVEGSTMLPPRVNALLHPLVGSVAVPLGSFRFIASEPSEEGALRAVLRAALRSAWPRVWLGVLARDPRDPTWRALRGVPRLGGRVHIVARPAEVDRQRLVVLE
jgi:ribosomal protein S18 acetylase RimI-like enzyme